MSLVLILQTISVRAQPVIDQFISNTELNTLGDCSLLRVNFHVRVRQTGHFPQDRGTQLEIYLQLVDQLAGVDQRLTPREGMRIANPGPAAIQSAYLALDEARGPVLHIQFLRPVSYQVVQSGSFETVAVAIARKGLVSACRFPERSGELNDQSLQQATANPATSVRAKAAPTGQLSEADSKTVDTLMDDARAAIRKGSLAEATSLLKQVLKYPENKSSAEAQELLGATELKLGQRARAIAEFEDYLRRYPKGEGTERVRQRLAAILTVDGPSQLRLQGAADPIGSALLKKSPIAETRWSMSGSVSVTYTTDDSANTVKDNSIAPNPNADPDAHLVHLNTLLNNFDVFGTSDNDQVHTRFKLAGTEEYQFDINSNRYGVSTAELDYTVKDYDVTARIGRQSRNTGGVIGRFDGAVISWQQSPDLRFNVLAGSPNWSRFDAPFKEDKTLYGASVDFGKVFGVLQTTLFAIEQYDRSLIDRQAIGAEFRYFDRNKSALGTLDYDVHFQQLNAAIFSGTYTLPDTAVLNTALDYRKVPYISSWNALQGQPFLTLYDMMRFNSPRDIEQLAIDRTPTFESAMVSYSRPLNTTYQIGGDATVTNLSGTPPSGGVDGTISTGLEYYLSAQISGSGVFRPGDVFMGALRYASLSDSKIYVIDLNSRYPITTDWAISPRLRLGYRSGVGQNLTETTILPSFLVSYLWSKGLSFESELGYKYMDSSLAGIRSITKDLFATVTIRKDFGADGATECRVAAISCAWAKPAAMQVSNQAPAAAWPLKAAAKAIPYVAFEGGVRYWFSSAKNRYDYFADPTPSTPVSRLTYGGLTGHTGEMFFRVDGLSGPLADIFLKGFFGGGKIVGGKLFDEDFSPFIDPFSMTSSDSSGRLQYASVDLGYNVFQISKFRLGVFVGYHHWLETVDAAGCTQVGGNPLVCAQPLPANLRVITEQDRWESGRAGVAVDGRLLERLTWQGEVAYVWTSQHATDIHYFTFGPDPASGTGMGFQAETFLAYQLANRFAVGVGGRWWHFNTNAIDSFTQLLRYTTDRYGVFVQGSYRFN